MWNQNDVNKVVLVSLLSSWDILTRVLTVSTSGNDHQANTDLKDIDPVILARKTGVKIWLDEGGRKVCRNGLLLKLAVKLLFEEIFYFRFHIYKIFIGSSMHISLQICMKFVIPNYLPGPVFMHAFFQDVLCENERR